MSTDDDIGRMQRDLMQMLRRAPESVRNGNWNTAIAFKVACIKAGKALTSKTPKYQQLREAHIGLSQYYKQEDLA